MAKTIKKGKMGVPRKDAPVEEAKAKKKSKDEKEFLMKSGEKDEDVYSEAGRELLEEDDEIESWEEGFMKGASGLGQLGKDALTGEPLIGAENIIEMELDGKLYRFVSEKNAEAFRKKKSKK